MGNCKGPISWYLGNVICYVEQPTSCSDARDSVVHAGEKYSAQACTVEGKNAISRNTSIIYSIIYNIKKKLYIDNEIFLNIVATSTAPSTTTTYATTTEPGNTS